MSGLEVDRVRTEWIIGRETTGLRGVDHESDVVAEGMNVDNHSGNPWALSWDEWRSMRGLDWDAAPSESLQERVAKIDEWWQKAIARATPVAALPSPAEAKRRELEQRRGRTSRTVG